MRTVFLGVLAVLCISVTTGCVGPNKLKRGLDRHLNQSYVNSPLRAQLMFPFNLVFNHIAVLGDLLILNPRYFWTEVFRGEGTAYVYEQVDMPAPPDDISPQAESAPP